MTDTTAKLRRGVTGRCSRSACACEAEGLGPECVWLVPTDVELERRTGEPHIDGYPLYSGLPPRAAEIGEEDMTDEQIRAAFKEAYPALEAELALGENNQQFHGLEDLRARHAFAYFKRGARAIEAELRELIADAERARLDHVGEAASWAEITTDELQLLPRKLLDLAGRVRTHETLYRDDDMIDTAAHALSGFLRQYTAETKTATIIDAARKG